MNVWGLDWVGVVVLVGTVGAGVLNVLLAAVATRRDIRIARVFRWLTAANGGLCLSTGLMYVSPPGLVMEVANRVATGFLVTSGVVFVLFAIVYAGYDGWLTRRRVGLIAALPVGYLLLLVTNPLHGLALSTVRTISYHGLSVADAPRTPLVDVVALYLFALSVVSVGLLVRFYAVTRTAYRKQTAVVIFGAIVIPAASFLHVGGVIAPVDPTPIMSGLTAVLVWVALFRYDFLDVVPLAADLLIEEMEDAVIVVDSEGTVRDANAAAVSLFSAPGDEPADEQAYIGRPLEDVFPALAERGTEDHISRPAADGDEERTFDVTETPLRDQFDIRRGSLLVLRDVTEAVRRRAEIERQNEYLNEFASVVSHDLRNPLGVAKGFTELVREGGDPAKLERVVDALDRMDALIDDLLTLAREGRDLSDVGTVSLATVANDAWRNVESEGTLTVGEVGVIQADANRLQQLLENLFRNAVEHGSAGSDPRARQDAVEHGSPDSDTDGAGVAITVGGLPDGFYVADDGPGIPEGERENVFETGYTTSESGTGFGLDIVRRVASAHGWTVHLTDGDDGGARFEFTGVERPADDTVE
ncbi:sensor histidine kinase [Haloarcula laminariae]|uniref:sensor histidine kinase n=1 Tax=Haloarcula laminariae TaxID=2961577 RepID=UPI00240607FF|nr:histidine kinase N-terminal 7TM domain-containing protein [Halomicroarcula sp. FL173]